MNRDGDIKSVNVDGSDVKTLISTNSSKDYYAIGVSSSNIYYADSNLLVVRNKLQISTSTVVYTASNLITSIYAFNKIGK